MSKLFHVARFPICLGLVLGSVIGCDSDSPTSTGTPPTISQLRAVAVQRTTAVEGILSFQFDYSDPDADVFVISLVTGIDNVNIAASDATMVSGTINVSRNIRFLAAGGEVPFTVAVVDRKGNRSNELQDAYETPP